MVRDFNSGKSTQKRNTASGRRATQSVRRVSSVPPVKRAGGTSNRSVKKPSGKRKGGFIAKLLHSDRTTGEMDYTFLLLVGVLVTFGLIMLLSASTPTANVKFGRSYHFFIRQFLFVALGAGAMFSLAHIDYRNLKPYARIFMIICIGLLVLVFLPGIGVSHNGSRRWINLGFMELQPSEIMKVSIAMFFAALIEDKKYDLKTNKGLGQYLVWIGVVAALLLAETHLSGTIVICGIALCVLLVGGANAGLIIGGGALGGAALVGLVAAINPTRMARLTSFLNPFTDMQGTGYQTAQAIYAIGSGGIFGKGLGESVQKFSYLPEPYNDFIFAVICEELGLVGAIVIIGMFAGLIIRGIKIAMEAEDVFGSLTVVGIMAQVAIQTILNIGVATASIPNTGVSLPFFSYGGTAIMILLAEMGIVLSVSRYSSENK
ncbi:MAG: putative lipid II flippase FtsW [Clostridia bacterium]|nr:putative lipid II flippase FtsW [Clostridia bacterium]